MEWLILIIYIILIILVIKYWNIALPLGAVGLLIYLIVKILKIKKKQKDEKIFKKQYHEEWQREYRKYMINIGEQSINLFESISKQLSSAEKYLDLAEVHFANNSFAPFWDSIENAVNMLGRFDKSVQKIKQNSAHYTELIKKYDDIPPEFPLSKESIERVKIGSSTAERLQNIVQRAQSNFKFAMIYEQRKTNQILIAGFNNLAQALKDMSYKISDSLDNLTSSIDSMSSTLNESMINIHSDVGKILDVNTQHYKEFSKEVYERAERERKIQAILDDIKKGRRPFSHDT